MFIYLFFDGKLMFILSLLIILTYVLFYVYYILRKKKKKSLSGFVESSDFFGWSMPIKVWRCRLWSHFFTLQSIYKLHKRKVFLSLALPLKKMGWKYYFTYVGSAACETLQKNVLYYVLKNVLYYVPNIKTFCWQLKKNFLLEKLLMRISIHKRRNKYIRWVE